MHPLSNVWLRRHNAKKSDAPPLSLDKILSLLEQTICLLGETSNSVSYRRRYNIQLFLDTSPVIPNVELVNFHALLKHLFSKEMLTKAVDIPQAGKISHFLVN